MDPIKLVVIGFYKPWLTLMSLINLNRLEKFNKCKNYNKIQFNS